MMAQDPQGAGPPQDSQQAGPLLSANQLDDLVAPIALYPDPLLSQVLAASTYREIVEAQQWCQQNRNLRGRQLIDAAKEQNWDPSVQALVAFPDAVRLLSSDVRWITDLGNAFLAQQNDVMDAVQRMRARARANGRLNSTSQQVVTTDEQYGQSAIEIEPANPEVIYVPVYNPVYVWGPPDWGFYPDLWYPGFGFGFGPAIYISGFFPGWYGWGGWGWGCGWFGHGLFVNAGFFNRFGFRGGFHDRFGRGGFAGGFNGRTAWSHDPGHRMGVPYPTRTVANRFGSNQFQRGGGQFGGANRGSFGRMNTGAGTGRFGNNAPVASPSNRAGANGFRSPSSAGGWQRFNSGNRATGNGVNGGWNRSASPNVGARNGWQGNRGPMQGYRGNSNAPAFRGGGSSNAPSYGRPFAPAYSPPRQNFAPRQNVAPRQNFAPRQKFRAATERHAAAELRASTELRPAAQFFCTAAELLSSTAEFLRSPTVFQCA